MENYEDPDGIENARKLVEEGMVEAWKRRWDLSQKGRHTYAFFPNVSSRQNSVIRGNTLHHTDGHGPQGIQRQIAQAGTGRGLSM